ncbi:MAG: hypothetical protein JWO05_2239 [Gemmatimonadetes bacterium]|nr:hypothetical protein [Gemmatimonadota bacterium]
MRSNRYAMNVFAGAVATLAVGSRLVPGHAESGPVLRSAVAFVSARSDSSATSASSLGSASSMSSVASFTSRALSAFSTAVGPLSRTNALESAFRGYFAFKAAHPGEVKKPLLYFVDYGLSSTTPRGYVFDMQSLQVVDGPFMVAHGRGSSTSQYGVPTRFSNASGSNATSLGLYVAEGTYDFHGHSGGRAYSSVGMRLLGVSTGFNDNAFDRRVVAHGAPYVTADKAGRSEGCPAMEPARAARLLPKLAQGGMVFLFAPNDEWLQRDPWASSTSAASQSASSGA